MILMIGLTETNLMIGDNVTKPIESYEQLIQRFTKRTMQLNARQDEIKGWYEEYVKNENDLKRLEGSLQAIQYVAYGKMPGDGNHDKFKDHTPEAYKKMIPERY
tara:strand:- start:411 stop:722 length:312 start_codon:yes stop_codon:yes gene_type:complete